VADVARLFARDEHKSKDGVWFALYGRVLVQEDLPEKEESDDPPARFRIISSNSPDAEQAVAAWHRKFRQAIAAGGKSSDDALREISRRIAGEVLIRDWCNLTQDGEPLPHSKEAAYALMRDVPELRAEVTRVSFAHEPYRLDEDGRKNS
jgi:hypothetical protein